MTEIHRAHHPETALVDLVVGLADLERCSEGTEEPLDAAALPGRHPERTLVLDAEQTDGESKQPRAESGTVIGPDGSGFSDPLDDLEDLREDGDRRLIADVTEFEQSRVSWWMIPSTGRWSSSVWPNPQIRSRGRGRDTDLRGIVSAFRYGLEIHRIETNHADLRLETIQYDAGGNPCFTTDVNGNTSGFEYGERNHVLVHNRPESATMRHRYDVRATASRPSIRMNCAPGRCAPRAHAGSTASTAPVASRPSICFPPAPRRYCPVGRLRGIIRP